MKRYIKSLVYGGLDGIITTFAVVSGAMGGEFGTVVVLALGLSNLAADGFSMAAGDYISSKTDGLTIKHALKNAFVTFTSFAIFGFIPLIAYLLPIENRYICSIILVSISLALLGFVKAKINEDNIVKSMLSMMFIGLTVSIMAYYLSEFVMQIL